MYVALFDPGNIIGEIQYLIVADRRYGLRHRGIVAMAGIILVAAQCLYQIVFTLVANARNILLPGKIRRVADIAMVLLNQCAGTRDAVLVYWTRRRRGAGNFAMRSAIPRTSSSLNPLVASFIGA
jgi:hypothetical protein